MILKKIIPLLVPAFLISCSNTDKSGKEKETAPREKHDKHSKVVSGLSLNNGAKWKIDNSTRSNIRQINILLEGPSAGKNIDQLGSRLTQKTDELINECRMKGPDHDALHKWLEHYLGNLEQFRDPAADREKAYTALQYDIQEFDEYFK